MKARAMLSRIGRGLASTAHNVLVPLPPAALAVIAVVGTLDASARTTWIGEVSRYADVVGMPAVMPRVITPIDNTRSELSHNSRALAARRRP